MLSSKEKCKQYRRRFKRLNPFTWKARNIYRSLKKYGVNIKNVDAVKEKIISTPNICIYCSDNLTYKNISIDHIIPISRGGSSSDWNNIHFICLKCNILKGNLLEHEFYTLLDFLNKNQNLRDYLTIRLRASGFMYRK